MRSSNIRKLRRPGVRKLRRMIRKVGGAALACLRMVPLDMQMSFGKFSRRFAILALLASASLSSNDPVFASGSPFIVNTATGGDQTESSVAMDASGDSVVVWTSTDANGTGIFGQRFDENCNPEGSQFAINTTTSGNQHQPDVAMAADGSFVVAWNSDQVGGGNNATFARRFDASGSAIGSEFQVTPGTFQFLSSLPTEPSVAIEDDGDILIAWSSEGFSYYYPYYPYYYNISWGLFQRYDSNGVLQGFNGHGFVSPHKLDQLDIALDTGGGGIIAARQFNGTTLDSDIVAFRFDASDNVSGLFLVNSTFSMEQTNPVVAIDKVSGDYTIAWETEYLYPQYTYDQIAAQRFSAADVPLGGEIQVSNGTDVCTQPRIAMDGDGDTTVTWETYDYYNAVILKMARYDTVGNLTQAEAPVAFSGDLIHNGGVATDDAGDNLMPAWGQRDDNNYPTYSFEIFAQCFDLAPQLNFALPASIDFCGEQIFLKGVDGNGLGDGTLVEFDANNDGTFEDECETDEDSAFVALLDANDFTSFPAELHVRATSPGGSVFDDIIFVDQMASVSPSNAIPMPESGNDPEAICNCACCGTCDTGAEALTGTFAVSVSGVNARDGVLLTSIPILSFPTKKSDTSANIGTCPPGRSSAMSPSKGFDLTFTHQSRNVYNGPVGDSWSHSFNMNINLDTASTGHIMTPDMRKYPISGPSGGGMWTLPAGFYSTLELDADHCRWKLTSNCGEELEFAVGQPGMPGYMLGFEDTNGNAFSLDYDHSGLLTQVTTDLGQEVTFSYNPSTCMLESVTDHLGRTWDFDYDANNNLVKVTTPDSTFADVGAGDLVDESNLGSSLVTGPREMDIDYVGTTPDIENITDPRGETPVSYTYNADGSVKTKTINDCTMFFYYEGQSIPANHVPDFITSGNFLAKLESGNKWTRVVDREGNICDYETHGATGFPAQSNQGKYGLRRKICWTRKGVDGNPIHTEDLADNVTPAEPDFWEQRWAHNCDCLAPINISEPFRNDDADIVGFDSNGMPLVQLAPAIYYPTKFYTYDPAEMFLRRQIIQCDYKGFSKSGVTISEEVITWKATYASFANFSRMLTYTPPRGTSSETNPLYAGLDFDHSYVYDGDGNMLEHHYPDVTVGPQAQSNVKETWTYNNAGQVETHIDENDNLTTYEYFTSSDAITNINQMGEFEGYLQFVTVGAANLGGDTDDPNITTEYEVNCLGMVTRMTDPNGKLYTTTFNDLGEVTLRTEPQITQPYVATFTTQYFYDGAGNVVLTRRDNIDHTGIADGFNPKIDSSTVYNKVNNVVKTSVEADKNGTPLDLVTEYAYDCNDQLIAVQYPEGNRSFTVNDERRLGFKQFYGVEPGPTILDGYPANKADETLTGLTAFVGFTRSTFDARYNTIRVRDGRGNTVDSIPDFYNRTLATADQLGHGMRYEYDDDSLPLSTEGGEVDNETGEMLDVLERSYHRFDERGSRYQTVLDVDVSTPEFDDADPDLGATTPGYFTHFDKGRRVFMSEDARGNLTEYFFDSANRTTMVRDALNNEVVYAYDQNGNAIQVKEREILEDQSGSYEEYFTTHEYDEENRRLKTRIRGLNNLIDHVTQYRYDSVHYTRQVIDAEGKVTESDRDDLGRTCETRRRENLGGTILIRNQFAYDNNSRKTQDIAYTNAVASSGQQTTRYGYDTLDRLTVTVYPDSDDTITYVGGVAQGGNGADTTFDRVEVTYDAVSNVTGVTEQRGVGFTNTFDIANRMTDQIITLPTGVVGEKKRQFIYDKLNRIKEANNDYARVQRDYDDLSRLKNEVQWIRLDGKGFTQGWKHPITVHSAYDQQSNNTDTDVLEGPLGAPVHTDLEVERTFDALNRQDIVKAAYFGAAMLTQKAQYTFFGPWRVKQKDFGNGATDIHDFDVKRRVYECRSEDASSALLTGFHYGTSKTVEGPGNPSMGYDRVDNPLHEIWNHDGGLADNFDYNARYELTGVEWRAASQTDYRTMPSGYTTMFAFDSNFNREGATFADPFGNDPTVDANYAITSANEYTGFDRSVNGGPTGMFTPTHDKAGNMTNIPLMPKKGVDAGKDVMGLAKFDAFNRLFQLKPGAIKDQHFRTDALGRRIARFELMSAVIAQPTSYTLPATQGRGSEDSEASQRGDDEDESRYRAEDASESEIESVESEALSGPVVVGPVVGTITVRPLNSVAAGGVRYIWDGWSCIEEREFVSGTALSNGASKLEQVYVNGKDIDEPICTAIDGNNDTMLNPQGLTKNHVGAPDFEYYFLSNRMGSIVGLLDADDDSRILEYYRYSVYGEATVLKINDTGLDPQTGLPNGGTAGDFLEDTPFDLTDNNFMTIDERNGVNNVLGDSDDVQTAGRISKFRNTFMYTARRLDEKSGLYYYRYRYYEARMGRFVGRDPARSPWRNLYGYVRGRVTWGFDPLGLDVFWWDEIWRDLEEAVNEGFEKVADAVEEGAEAVGDAVDLGIAGAAGVASEVGEAIDEVLDEVLDENIAQLKAQQSAAAYNKDHPNWWVDLPKCPCKNPDKNGVNAFDGWASDGEGYDNYKEFHTGAYECFRSYPAKLIKDWGHKKDGPGQQCCYDACGELITGGKGAGTPDRVGGASGEDGEGNAERNLARVTEHWNEDVTPWSTLGWELYNQYWPPNNGNNCKENCVSEIPSK